MKKADDGILFPAPSVKAAEALEKYAKRPIAVRLAFSVQAVVAVTVVAPGLDELPAFNVKTTALAERLTVSASASVALIAMDCTPEAAPPGPVACP